MYVVVLVIGCLYRFCLESVFSLLQPVLWACIRRVVGGVCLSIGLPLLLSPRCVVLSSLLLNGGWRVSIWLGSCVRPDSTVCVSGDSSCLVSAPSVGVWETGVLIRAMGVVFCPNVEIDRPACVWRFCSVSQVHVSLETCGSVFANVEDSCAAGCVKIGVQSLYQNLPLR